MRRHTDGRHKIDFVKPGHFYGIFMEPGIRRLSSNSWPSGRSVPERRWLRLASFDRETLVAAKAQLNRFGTPTATELKSSTDLFFSTLALPGAQACRVKIGSLGYGVASDFELNFGRYLPALGRADGDDMGRRPD
jgi:hypothetical protein